MGRRGKGVALLLLWGGIMSLPGCNLQDRMLYYPEGRRPAAAELAAANLAYWPAGPAGYRGFAAPAGGGGGRGTVVVFHGNAGTAADRAFYAAALTPLGYRVLLAEYPAYGGRPGALGEPSLVRDARETLRLAAAEGGPLYLLGESLGCGVAAAVAADPAHGAAGLLLITPWETLLGVARDHFPWLPVRLFLRDRYDNRKNLQDFTGRVAIVGAERDEIVPVRHARSLYEALPGPKRLWILPATGHNDWPGRVDAAQWRAWMDFVGAAGAPGKLP